MLQDSQSKPPNQTYHSHFVLTVKAPKSDISLTFCSHSQSSQIRHITHIWFSQSKLPNQTYHSHFVLTVRAPKSDIPLTFCSHSQSPQIRHITPILFSQSEPPNQTYHSTFCSHSQSSQIRHITPILFSQSKLPNQTYHSHFVLTVRAPKSDISLHIVFSQPKLPNQTYHSQLALTPLVALSLCYFSMSDSDPEHLSNFQGLVDLYTIETTPSSDSSILCVPSIKTKTFGQRSFSHAGPVVWSQLTVCHLYFPVEAAIQASPQNPSVQHALLNFRVNCLSCLPRMLLPGIKWLYFR